MFVVLNDVQHMFLSFTLKAVTTKGRQVILRGRRKNAEGVAGRRGRENGLQSVEF